MESTEEKSRENIVFKPKYPRHIMVTVYLYPVGVIIFIFFIYMALASQKIFPYGLYALIFGFTILSMPMILFREVRFNDAITLKRYFLPPRTIQYKDVVDLTPRGLVVKRGGIALTNVQNRAEFEKIIKRLVARHVIRLEK
jgi:hypothetical protein